MFEDFILTITIFFFGLGMLIARIWQRVKGTVAMVSDQMKSHEKSLIEYGIKLQEHGKKVGACEMQNKMVRGLQRSIGDDTAYHNVMRNLRFAEPDAPLPSGYNHCNFDLPARPAENSHQPFYKALQQAFCAFDKTDAAIIGVVIFSLALYFYLRKPHTTSQQSGGTKKPDSDHKLSQTSPHVSKDQPTDARETTTDSSRSLTCRRQPPPERTAPTLNP